MPGADGGQGRPAWPDHVDHMAAGPVPSEGAPCFCLQVGPALVGDRGELAMQVVHPGLLRLPMCREGSGTTAVMGAGCAAVIPGGSGRSSSRSAEGTKNRLPVTAVEKSSIRSVLPGGLPKNMLISIRSVTSG